MIKKSTRKKWAIFISGTGSNLRAILELSASVEIGLVVSSSSEATGILHARRLGIPTYVSERKIDWENLHQVLIKYHISSVFLLGFMKIVPAAFLSKWEGDIVNLHPSLLPLYPGLDSIKKAFEDKSPLGVTIHTVVPEIDAGPVHLQRGIRALHTLEQSELSVHVCEQRCVREVVLC